MKILLFLMLLAFCYIEAYCLYELSVRYNRYKNIKFDVETQQLLVEFQSPYADIMSAEVSDIDIDFKL